jgi:hypothetical protein
VDISQRSPTSFHGAVLKQREESDLLGKRSIVKTEGDVIVVVVAVVVVVIETLGRGAKIPDDQILQGDA